MEMML